MRTPKLWMVVGISAAALAASSLLRADGTAAAGLCFAPGADGAAPVIVPLESTEVVLDVKPGLVEAQVIQMFTNHTNTALEAKYLYPLPHDATLTNFELRYRDRVVRSVVRAKAEARATYEQAKAAGQKAALLEQADPSMFSTAVANFLPGETVQIVIRFVQPLSLTAEAIDVRFPMVTGEKYFPADIAPGTPGNAAPNPERLAREAIAAGHVYAFDIQIAGIPVREITSATHAIRVEAGPAGQTLVALAEEITIPDRDFVLRIETEPRTGLQPTLVTQRTATGDYGLLTLFPPMQRDGSKRAGTSRDILFLLDRSGSMGGERIASARLGLEGCLAAMLPDDRFQIVTYDDRFEFYRTSFVPATAAAVAEATAFVRVLQSRGGTDLQPALAASLAAFGGTEREHVLILLTDGDVGNHDTLMNLVEGHIGRARIFAFGIGTAPNAFLLRQIAELGHGQARFIDAPSAIERELRDLFETLDAPVLSNLRVSLVDRAGVEIDFLAFPQTLPDVFIGRPLQLTFRTSDAVPGLVRVEGMQGDQEVAYEIAVGATPLRGDALEKHFGRAWYAQQEADRRRAETDEGRTAWETAMLHTALEFDLVTELTSRVAVERNVARAPGAPLQSVNVPQYTEADRVVVVGGEEVITLSPFEVTTEGEVGYAATTTLAGSRLRTELRDVGASVQVVTRQFMQDLAVAEAEALAGHMVEPVQDPRWVHPGADVGLIDGLPITTLPDPAMTDHLTWRSQAPAWSSVELRRAARRDTARLTTRLGDEGFAAATLDVAWNPVGEAGPAITSIVNWSQSEHEQRGLYLDVRRFLETINLRGTVQWRDLADYGHLRLLRAGWEWRPNEALNVSATIAAHELVRDDAAQFRLGAPVSAYGGLGLFNLDTLTAETRRLRDHVAMVDSGGQIPAPWGRTSWSLRTGWHRQTSAWSAFEESGVADQTRNNGFVRLGGESSFLDDRVHVQAQAGWARHAIDHTVTPRFGTRQLGGTVSIDVTSSARLILGGGRDERLPWVPFAFIPVETRDGRQLGIEVATSDDRLSAALSLFRDRVHDFTARDWAAEKMALDLHGTPGAIRYWTWDRFERAGVMGQIEFMPVREWSLHATWYVDTKDEGPEQGGNHRGSLLTRYEFREGWCRGFFVGGGVTYSNALRFADGFTLTGGVRGDAFVGCERSGTLVQLNLVNVSGRADRATRFAPDRGRQLRLTVAREF